MTTKEETAYEQGNREAWKSLLSLALKKLDCESPEATNAKWVLEREAAIQSLRSLCREFGDNEWDESLHMQDIIENHLGDHLRS